MQRIEAMIHYASSGHKCRSQSLLQYFGEKESVRCGKCDVCRERNELNLSKYEFDTISEQIKKVLLEPCFYEELLKQIEGKPDAVVKVVRWLLENEKAGLPGLIIVWSGEKGRRIESFLRIRLKSPAQEIGSR